MREVKEALRELKEIQQQAYDKGYEDVASRLCVRIKYICEDHGFEEEYRRQVEKLEKIPFSDPLKASEYLLAFHALNGRAELFRKSKKYQEAKNLHLKAFNLYSSGDEPHHNIWLQVYALYHLAALEYERRNLVEARQYIDRAYETARDNKIHDRAIKCLQLKTEIVLLEQDYKDAYLSMKLIQDHRMTIDSLQEGFDMEKYYIQIERQKLAAEKEAQSLELRLKNGEMISFSVIALLAIVLAVAMFLSMRRQSRDTRQLAGQYALIRQQAQQLQSLDVAKTRFFTNISHEFRTPLTVILGMAEQIKTLLQESVSQPYPPENPHPALAPHYLESMRQEGQQHITLIQRNGKNLLQLVNQILDLSKMDSGLLTVNWHHGNIIAYLQYLTESFYSLAQNKGVCLVFYSEVTVLNMDYDPEKTQAVVINLLSNALKFTQKGGKIVLHTSQLIAAPDKPEAVGCLQLKFQDSGKGIPSDELPHIFNRFYQVDDSSTRLNEGTGIGLSLVKEFVGLLGGSIGVESTIGQGTTFNLLLPIHHQAEGLESIPQSASTSTSLRPSGSGEAPASARSRPVLGDTKLPLLLLIEDNADVVTYLTGLLENT